MKWRVLLILFVGFFFFARKTYATITVTASSVSPNGQVLDDLGQMITVTVSDATGMSYLRPVFYKQGTSDYFGCVQTTCGTYYCGTDYAQYPSIINGSISFKVRTDMSAPNYTKYSSNPDTVYAFKIRRCTISDAGNVSCSIESDEQAPLHITQTVSTPTPSPQQNTCPFPTPTPPVPTPSPTPSPTPTPSPAPSPTPVPQQPTNVFLSEFVACPSSGSEWVELYNANADTVTLSNWKIKDNTDSHAMTVNDSISGKGYKTFDISGFSLNNNGDNVRLYDGAGSPVDSRVYTTCNNADSWAKKPDGSWDQTPFITKGSANQFPTPIPTPSPTPKITPTPSPDPTTMEGAEVLGTSTDSGNPSSLGTDPSPSPTAGATVSGTLKDTSSQVFAFGAIGLGTMSLCTLGGYLWYDWWKKKRVIVAP